MYNYDIDMKELNKLRNHNRVLKKKKTFSEHARENVAREKAAKDYSVGRMLVKMARMNALLDQHSPRPWYNFLNYFEWTQRVVDNPVAWDGGKRCANIEARGGQARDG